MSKHTATPWLLLLPKTIHGPEPALLSGSGEIVCSFERDADAAFAYRAVNAHNDLVAALKGCRDALGEIPQGYRFNHDSNINRQIERAEAALAKAQS